MIIDVHTHLGNILYPDGGKLIYQKGVKKEKRLNMVSISESGLHRTYGILERRFYRLAMGLVTIEERRRNLTATLENICSSMDENGIDYSACMPIPPYLNFEDLQRAQKIDSRIIPFTGIDYTREYDIKAALASDVANGAKGLKLHPIIQRIPLNSKKTFDAVSAFAPHGLPVLFHSGVSSYYPGEEKSLENPEYGEIHYAVDLISAFPDVNFIAGHAGLYELNDVINMLGKFQNLSVDISFQSPSKVRKLIKTLGPERVLFGSDWPWGNRIPAIKVLKAACRGDTRLEQMIFHENAARLLRIS